MSKAKHYSWTMWLHTHGGPEHDLVRWASSQVPPCFSATSFSRVCVPFCPQGAGQAPHVGAPTDLVALRALTALTRKKIIPRKFPLLKVFRWR